MRTGRLVPTDITVRLRDKRGRISSIGACRNNQRTKGWQIQIIIELFSRLNLDIRLHLFTDCKRQILLQAF